MLSNPVRTIKTKRFNKEYVLISLIKSTSVFILLFILRSYIHVYFPQLICVTLIIISSWV